MRDLPEHFAAWASVPAAEPDLTGLTRLLGGTFIGVQLPATALGSPAGWHAVGEVLQLQSAWWAWHAFSGRAQFPRLRLVFAAGAGLAPVHHERLTARGGRLGAVDPGVFVDTSSYGAQGLDALTRALGIDSIVLGSDRPYAEPLEALLGEAATRAVRVDNPRRALGGDPHRGLETAPDMEAVA